MENKETLNENLEDKFILFPDKCTNLKHCRKFREEFEVLKENSDISTLNKNASEIRELDLLFIPKIKSLDNFFPFQNLRELNIISPLAVSSPEDFDEERSSNNLNSFQLSGVEHIANKLTILRLVNCGIKEIDRNFLFLKNLEDLSLGENRIAEIRNLHNCMNLKKLFLYSNKISKIEYLQDCLLLEEIDLSDNLIFKVENLDSIKGLKKLSLAGNKIESLANVNGIKTITALEEVYFNDENYWPNPICENFQNYFDHILTLKSDLKILDSLLLEQINNSGNKQVNNSSINIPSTTNCQFSKYFNFNRNVTEINNNLRSINDRAFKETLILKNLREVLEKVHEEKMKNLMKEIEKENNEQHFLPHPNLSNFLKLEMEFYFEFLETHNLRFDQKSGGIFLKQENKINLVSYYLDLFIEINKFLNFKAFEFLESQSNSNYTELKILKFEHMYDFFKKFFPPYFLQSFNSVPMIAIRFIHKGNMYNGSTEYESYMDFCNYETIIIDDLHQNLISNSSTGENFEDFIKPLLNKNYYKNKKKIKFYKIKEKEDFVNNLDKYAILFVDSNNVIKYLIFFFKIVENGNILLTSDNDNSSNIGDDLIAENFYNEITNKDDSTAGVESDRECNSDPKKRLIPKDLYKEIQTGEEMNDNIISKEKSIQNAIEDNNILINDILNMLS